MERGDKVNNCPPVSQPATTSFFVFHTSPQWLQSTKDLFPAHIQSTVCLMYWQNLQSFKNSSQSFMLSVVENARMFKMNRPQHLQSKKRLLKTGTARSKSFQASGTNTPHGECASSPAARDTNMLSILSIFHANLCKNKIKRTEFNSNLLWFNMTIPLLWILLL